MRKIRVGILGTGSIVRRIMTDFPNAQNCELAAIASSDLSRAQSAAQKYGAPRAFGSYEELAACPDVDLVYVASLHNAHRKHANMMLEAGKAVLCEKPFALNDREARDMIRLAKDKNVFLMEAMWSRFMPAMRDLKARVDAGELGEIRMITANFGYAAAYDPESRAYNMARAGGALLDVGVYAISFASLFLGAEATDAHAECVKAPTGADARFLAQVAHRRGGVSQIVCAVDTATESRAMIYGEKGYAEVPDFWHATRYALNIGGKRSEYAFPPETEGHHHEFAHAAECIQNGLIQSPVMPLDETEGILRLMTRLRADMGIRYPEETGYAEA